MLLCITEPLSVCISSLSTLAASHQLMSQ